VVAAPTPAEAAAALKGVAVAAKRAGVSPRQSTKPGKIVWLTECWHLVVQLGLGTLSPCLRLVASAPSLPSLWLMVLCRCCAVNGLCWCQARDRVVLGLVECLRLTPPAHAPHQQPSLSQRLWAIAKAYWLQAGAAATAAQQQLLAAAAASSGSQQPGQAGSLSASKLAGAPVMGQLLAQLQSAGLSLNRQQLAAAQTLMQSRQQTQLVQQGCVGAVWALSVSWRSAVLPQEIGGLVWGTAGHGHCQMMRGATVQLVTVSFDRHGTCPACSHCLQKLNATEGLVMTGDATYTDRCITYFAWRWGRGGVADHHHFSPLL